MIPTNEDELFVDEDNHTFSWGTHFHIYKWEEIKASKSGEGPWPKCNICHLPARHGIVNTTTEKER